MISDREPLRSVHAPSRHPRHHRSTGNIGAPRGSASLANPGASLIYHLQLKAGNAAVARILETCRPSSERSGFSRSPVQRLFSPEDLPPVFSGIPISNRGLVSEPPRNPYRVVQRAFRGLDLPNPFAGVNRAVSPRLGSAGYVYNLTERVSIAGTEHSIHISVPGISVVPTQEPGFSVHTDYHITLQAVGVEARNRHYHFDENGHFLETTSGGYRSDRLDALPETVRDIVAVLAAGFSHEIVTRQNQRLSA